MSNILTLTMNPALDLFSAIDKVAPSHKLRCDAAQFHPGGGGINVARVLRRLGTDVLALFPAGGVTGQRLQQLLAGEQVPHQVLPIAGETRESFSVHERSSGQDFRFVLPGPVLAEPEWQACLDAVAKHVVARYIVASGSLPPGVPDDFYARLARQARRTGARLVLDTSGPALAAALAEGVYLVKPSQRELGDLTGLPLDNAAQQLDTARSLITRGQAQVVALSLGASGALLVTADGAWRAPSLPVAVESTIGAGDSFVGGLLAALNAGEGWEAAFRQAMAAGAAALLTAGTALCQPADVQRLMLAVQVAPG